MTLETAKQGLTEKQIETLVTLVRLGDSVELALATTREEFEKRPWQFKDNSAEFCRHNN